MPLPAVARYLCFHGGRGDGALNRGLAAFKDELSADALAMKRVGLGIVSCGSVRMLADFHTPDLFQPLLPSAAGDKPMGTTIAGGLENLVLQRAARTVETPSLGSMVAPVQRSTATGIDVELSRALGGYLSGPPVNDRIGHDKTLVLASRWHA